MLGVGRFLARVVCGRCGCFSSIRWLFVEGVAGQRRATRQLAACQVACLLARAAASAAQEHNWKYNRAAAICAGPCYPCDLQIDPKGGKPWARGRGICKVWSARVVCIVCRRARPPVGARGVLPTCTVLSFTVYTELKAIPTSIRAFSWFHIAHWAV
jgi:hypothetical protein